MSMLFHCAAHNDLYRTVQAAGVNSQRFDSLQDAVEAAPHGSAVLSLADAYPGPGVRVDRALLEKAKTKPLRLYIEYPDALEGVSLGEPVQARWERAVVTSEFFAPELERMRILSMHGCWYRPVEAGVPHLVLAKVAGYDRAVYGLPETVHPLLVELPDYPVLLAASKLSHFITGRYAPTAAWKALWEHILAWLAGGRAEITLTWTPAVRVTAGPNTPLPEGAEAEAFTRSVRFFREQALFSIDHKKGAIEGFESLIDPSGRQMRRIWIRADCVAETGMLFALDWAITKDPSSKALATQILDYAWSEDFYHADPSDPAYGLVNWYERGPVFYGDDNARVLLATMTASRLLNEDRWDERVLTCLLANLRTTGTLGFRRARIELKHLEAASGGWRFFRGEAVEHYAPHFQAYLWACYLWGYALTGYEGFLARTKGAIRMMLDRYPKWQWTNGLTQEMARMLLPLAFLVRLEDTPEHRRWLNRMAGELLKYMQPSGAIQEHMGAIEDGRYPAPRSNAAYGTAEASLIQENGDPACDLLYTANYAFLGLYEAAQATGDPMLRAAEGRLADFFCRVQVVSETVPYLNGVWMRSFDYEKWEYWGSSADLGWGPWCVETGWTNTWIAGVLALRRLGQALFSTEGADRFQRLLPKVLAALEME